MSHRRTFCGSFLDPRGSLGVGHVGMTGKPADDAKSGLGDLPGLEIAVGAKQNCIEGAMAHRHLPRAGTHADAKSVRNTIPYNFVNTRSCNYFGDSMPALLRAGAKTNRVNEDEGEKNQKTPKNLAKRHTMRGQLTGEQILRKWEESSRVRTQTETGFGPDLKRARKAEKDEREKENPRELRTKMLAVVAMLTKDIMKQGTASDFDVDTFVPSNVWATDDVLAAEADHMDRLEDDVDADAPGGATPTGETEAGGEDDANAANEGGDADIAEGDGGDDVDEEPIQVELTALELQVEDDRRDE